MKSKPFPVLMGIAGVLLSSLCVFGCGGGSEAPAQAAQTRSVQTTLAAGMRELTQDETDSLSGEVDATRLGFTGFDRTYSVTTPPGEEFAFTVVASRFGNTGETKVSVAHVKDGEVTPWGGSETLTEAGLRVVAPGINADGAWVNVSGDGFARISISGRIEAPQVIAIDVPQPEGGSEKIGVEISLGPPSDINVTPSDVDGDADIKSDTTIYSSNSWQFGLPAIAASGDRVTVVAYDGDSSNPDGWERRRRWLQMDTGTLAVSGGTASSTSSDSGFWRDQEIASLGNVIAIVYTGNGQVRTDISLDRGASFPVQHVLESEESGFGQRLVQVGISNNYRLAFLYWRSRGDWMKGESVSELVLVEAVPGSLDANNTPVSYEFQAPVVVKAPGRNVTPLVMDVKYSGASDLVVAYGYTEFLPLPQDLMQGLNRAVFCCAVRLYGGQLVDKIVDMEENIVPMDPSVAIIGSGPSMRLFYAYEKTTGIHLRQSLDAGLTFEHVTSMGTSGAYLPSVHARYQGSQLRLDVLYLEATANGTELHSKHWDDFNADPGNSRLLRLTTAVREEIPGSEITDPGAPSFIWEGGKPTIRITEIASFGYDAVDDGDDVVIVLHQRTQETWYYWGIDPRIGIMPPIFFGPAAGFDSAAMAGEAAPPPVLLPGLSGSVPAPDAAHSSQLKVLVLN